MADDSPGKVQALRAIFSEKNTPLMGMMPPGGKIPNRPWRSVDNSAEDVVASKEKKFNELRLGNRVFPTPEKNASSLHGDIINGYGSRNVPKPVVGPKPTHLQQKTLSPLTVEPASADDGTEQSDGSCFRLRTANDDGQTSKTKAFAETIASFMFTSNKENDSHLLSDQNNPGQSSGPPPIPKPRTSRLQNHVEIMNLCNNSQNLNGFRVALEGQSCNISSDNYICNKNNYRVRRRRELPSHEKLGSAPLKPSRPPHLKLPSQSSSSSAPSSQSQTPPALPQKPIPQRPSYPCPPRPQTSPPLPPVAKPSLREELEELYEDTIQEGRRGRRPVSLIPEYTEEEEQAEELYNDAAAQEVEESFVHRSRAMPSEYLQPNITDQGSNEELYQDADELETEEFYEIMPCDEIPDESGSPLYSNNKKEIEKLKKEEEKKIRKEQKEKDKREREMEKLKKKFGLTGGEIPIDDGLVKCDSRGGKGDLPVKRGETVLILRMEGNPSGRWLVKNEKGKIGYVELTNIEVMSIQRLSSGFSHSDELYCEAKSEEAIYEVTY